MYTTVFHWRLYTKDNIASEQLYLPWVALARFLKITESTTFNIEYVLN